MAQLTKTSLCQSIKRFAAITGHHTVRGKSAAQHEMNMEPVSHTGHVSQQLTPQSVRHSRRISLNRSIGLFRKNNALTYFQNNYTHTSGQRYFIKKNSFVSGKNKFLLLLDLD